METRGCKIKRSKKHVKHTYLRTADPGGLDAVEDSRNPHRLPPFRAYQGPKSNFDTLFRDASSAHLGVGISRRTV